MKVKDPSGQTWRVSRRWVPWRRRLRNATDLMPDLPALGDDPISAILGILFLIVMIPFFILAFLVALEFLLILLLIPLAAIARALFGGEWIVEVRKGFRPHWEAKSGNWSASGRRIEQIGEALRRGEHPPANLQEP